MNVRRIFGALLLLAGLFSGTALAGTPIDLERRTTTTIRGASEMQGVGHSIAPAGDVNGDSVPDLLVRADPIWGEDPLAWVIFGGSADPIDVGALGDRGFAISMTGSNSMRSYEMTGVAGVGDLNADGLDDVLIGVPWADNNARENSGSVYVIFGKADNATVELSALSTGGLRIDGADENDELGVAVARGDVDGDDKPDIIAGAPFAGNELPNPGKVYVVFGRSLAVDVDLSLPFDGFAIEGETGRQAFGDAVAGAGDMNGDGFEEIVIGAPTDSYRVRSGAYLVHGKDVVGDIDIAGEWSGWRMLPTKDSGDDGEFGRAVAGGSDFNGDGLPDLLVGGPYADGVNGLDTGAAYVVLGAADRPDVQLNELGSAGLKIVGPDPIGATGGSVAFVPDTDGDGRAEALVGSPQAGVFGAYETGRVDIVLGQADTTSIDLGNASEVLTYSGVEGERAGSAVAYAGDFASSAEVLLAVGASHATIDDVYRTGRVYLVSPTPPANDFPPRATLYSYRARQAGLQGSYCWDGVCADRIPSVPTAEPAAVEDKAVIVFGIDGAPEETTLILYRELDEFGRPAGEGRAVQHRVRPDPRRGIAGHQVAFELPKRIGHVYLALQARWAGDDKGDASWFFHLNLDEKTYTDIDSPPNASLRTGSTRQDGAMYSYTWCQSGLYGFGVCMHADAFDYGFPPAKPGRHDAPAVIRVHDRHRPNGFVIRMFRRVEQTGEEPWASEYPVGRRRIVEFSWRAVRRNGRVVAHDARFRLPQRGRHAYYEVRGRWRFHGTAPWQFHLRFP